MRDIFYCFNKSRQLFKWQSIRTFSTTCSKFGKTSKQNDQDIIDDGPIKFSQSGAAKWKATYTRTGISSRAPPRLWYEPYVIMVSLTVFMIYFFILREENDLDAELNRSLYSRIEGLEEHQLKLSLEYNQKNGLDTADILQRLKEIELEKQQKKQQI